MSKTIDERVVSMQFDNKHFESNVQTTMSTLDKLKQSLNLSGASKGLENVSAAASECNLSPISSAIESVKVKFSAMEVVAVTALANITNSAINAGKQIVTSLTITPITTGFNEYELKMGSIQTIMAATGESLEVVNQYLNELNEYSDQTIYSFQDMTTNISKFTNAGVGLEDAVTAIKGIANEAAVSGATANEAARAMYNFSQALSTGYVQRIDWKSIELANMATVEFKEQLLDSAVAMGTVTKNASGMYKAVGDKEWYNTSQMFIETLDEQWLTSEVLIETLKDYADETTDIGKKAKAAATEVKTFTMMMDTLKETAQSGWAQTWEIIVGDFDEAKSLFTKLSDFIGGMLSKSAEKRNAMLERVFNSASIDDWDELSKQVEDAGVSLTDFQDTLIEVGKEHGVITDEMIKANGGFAKSLKTGWATTDIVIEALKKLGGAADETAESYETLTQYTVKSGDNLSKIAKKYGTTWQKIYEANKDIIGDNPNLIFAGQVYDISLALDELTDAELKNIGYTEEEIKTLRGLQEQAKDANVSVSELIKQLEAKPTRRETLISSFATLWEKLSKIFDAVKQGWDNVFGNSDMGGFLSKIIDKFADWVDNLEITEEVLGNITSVVEGLCSAIQLGTILGGGLFGVLNSIISNVTKVLGLNLLTVLGNLGNAITNFRKILISDNTLSDWFEKLGTGLNKLINTTITKIGELVNAFLNLEFVKQFIADFSAAIGGVVKDLGNWFGGFGTIISTFIENLQALDSITLEGVWNAVKRLGQDIWAHFGGLGGVFSGLLTPIKNFGKALLEYFGLYDELQSLIGWLTEAKKAWEDWCNGVEGSEDLPQRVAEGIVNGLGKALGYVVEIVKGMIKAIVNLITGTPDEAAEGVSEGAQSIANNLISGLVKGIGNGIKFVAETIVELGKALINKFCEVLGIQSPSKVFFAFGGFIIAGLLAGLLSKIPAVGEVISNIGAMLSEKFGPIATTLKEKFGNIATVIKTGLGSVVTFLKENFGSIVAIIGGLLIITAVTKLASAIGGLTSVVSKISGAISGMFKSFGDAAMLIAKASAVVLFAVAIKYLAEAFTILADLSWGDIGKGAAVVAGFAIIVVVLAFALTKISKSVNAFDAPGLFGVAAIMITLAAAVGILVYSLTMMDDIDDTRIWKHIGAIAVLVVGLAGIAALMSKLKGEISKGSLAMIAVAAAILILVFALTKLNALVIDDPAKTIGALIAMAAGLALVAFMSKGINGGAALGMLGMVIAIRLFINTLEKIAEMDKTAMEKSIGTILGILLMFAGLMAATRLMGKDSGKDMMKVCAGILMLSLALVVVVAAIKMIAKMDPSELEQGLKAVSIILLIFAVLIGVSKFAGSEAMKAGVMIVMLSAALLIIAGAMWVLAFIPEEGFDRALAAVSQLMILFAVVIYVSKFAQKATGSLIAIAITLGVLVVALGVLSMIPAGDLMKAVGALSAVMVVLMLLIASLKFVQTNGKQAVGTVATLLVVAGIVFLLGYLIKDLAGMDNIDNAVTAAEALSILLISISAACFLLGKAGTISASAVLGAVVMGIVLGEIVLMLRLMNELDVVPNIETALSLSILLLALSAATLILSKVGGGAMAAVTGAAAMMAVIAIIGAVAAAIGGIMSLIPQEQIEKWKTGLAAFMDFIVILAEGLGEAIGALVGGILAGVGLGLSEFMNNIQDFITGASSIDESVLTGVGYLAGAIAALTVASVLDGIASLFGMGIEGLGPKLASFGESMIAFADSVSTLSDEDVAKIEMAAKAGKAMADMESSIPKQGGWVQAILGESDMEAFGLRMEAFGQSLVKYAASISSLTETDATNIENSAISGKAMADLEHAIPKQGGWAQSIMGSSDMEAFGLRMEAFGQSLVKYAASISSLTETDATNIENSVTAGNAMAALESAVPKSDGWWQKIAGEQDLSTFGTRMVSFGESLIAYAKAVADMPADASDKIAASKAAAEALVEVAKSIPKDGGWLGDALGEQNFVAFGDGMYSVANALRNYSRVAADIDDADVTNIENTKPAIEALSEVSNAVPTSGGIWDAIAGGKDMSSFGTGMKSLGESLVAYSNTVSGDSIDTEAITNSKDAIIAMAAAAKALPNEGGLVSLFSGDNNDLASFGTGMCTLAQLVVDYVDIVCTIGEEELTHIVNSSAAIIAMAEAAKALPNEGGLASLLVGDNNDLASFGTGMCELAQSVVNYAAIACMLNEESIAAITNSRDAIVAMAAAARVLPNEGGLAALFSGDNNDFASFGTGMCELARSVVNYATIVSAIGEDSVANITNSKNVIRSLVDAARAAVGLVNIDLSGALNTIDALVELTDVAKNLSNVDLNGLGSFTTAMGSLGEAGVDSFISAFTGAASEATQAGTAMMTNLLNGMTSSKETVSTVITELVHNILDTLGDSAEQFIAHGESLMISLAAGIKTKETQVSSALKTCVAAAVTAVKNLKGSANNPIGFYGAGKDLGSGLVNGMNAKQTAVYNAGYALGQKAVQGEKDGQNSNSPSKLTEEAGNWLGEGLVIGMKQMMSSVYNTGSSMGKTATTGISSAISKITDAINSDIDSQPTIRPVLDLSDISSGASLINGMLGVTPSVGVLSNVGTISSMMNGNQNGTNDDIISAIQDLKRTIGASSGDTYQINGVTYDEGTATADAVRQIAKAALRERRV